MAVKNFRTTTERSCGTLPFVEGLPVNTLVAKGFGDIPNFLSIGQYFQWFKVQVVTTADGLPVDYFITAGSIHDNTALQSMQLVLPEGSEVYADSAYTNYELEDLYNDCEQIRLLVERKANSKRPDSVALRFLKKYYRKRIETSFSEITAHFPSKIHAVTPQGFLFKIVLFLFAFTLNKTLSAT